MGARPTEDSGGSGYETDPPKRPKRGRFPACVAYSLTADWVAGAPAAWMVPRTGAAGARSSARSLARRAARSAQQDAGPASRTLFASAPRLARRCALAALTASAGVLAAGPVRRVYSSGRGSRAQGSSS